MSEDTRLKNEDKWFAENEESLIREARRAHRLEMEKLAEHQREGEEKRLRELHYLKCPKCGHDMRVAQHEGIEIEECGTCGGIFLDKGELMELSVKTVGARKSVLRRLLGMEKSED